MFYIFIVAPRAGAWIEIGVSGLVTSANNVVPRAGAWIEIPYVPCLKQPTACRPSRRLNTNLKLNHLIKTLRQFRLSSEVNGVVITVKDYQQIRQMFLCGISQRQIARQLHISEIQWLNTAKVVPFLGNAKCQNVKRR